MSSVSQTPVRVVSDYTHDVIFEQPRDGLIMQQFKTYEKVDGCVRVKTITRRYDKNGDYHDTTMTDVLD